MRHSDRCGVMENKDGGLCFRFRLFVKKMEGKHAMGVECMRR